MSQHKVALVTGASRGIGQAVLLALGRAGFTVVGTATTAQGAENITRALKTAGIVGQGIVLNVTSVESMTAGLHAIKEL